MRKIEFVENEQYKDKDPMPTDDKYILLSYFISDYRYGTVNDVLDELIALQQGVKVFNQIQSPNGYWTFGNEAGYLEADKDVAHFIAWGTTLESFDMPLSELIGLLKEWKAFLGE